MVKKIRKQSRKAVKKNQKGNLYELPDEGSYYRGGYLVAAVGACIIYAWKAGPLPLPLSVINMGSPWESTRPVYTGGGNAGRLRG